MAGLFGSASVWFLVDGYNVLASKLQGVTKKVTALQVAGHGVGDSWEESIPTGIKRADLTQADSFFDTTALYSHAAFNAAVPGTPQTAARVACLGYAADTLGEPFTGFAGAHTMSYEVLAQNGDLTKANVEHSITGQVEEGQIVHILSAGADGSDSEAASLDNTGVLQQVVAITSSSVANPTNILCAKPHGLVTGDTVLIANHAGSTPDINGEEAVTVVDTLNFTVAQNVSGGGTGGTITKGKTNAGASCYLQVTSLTLGGWTSATVTVRDSADDITFGDLVAFTTVTSAQTAERVTIAGAIERYVAQKLDFVGAGAAETMTYFVGVARNSN